MRLGRLSAKIIIISNKRFGLQRSLLDDTAGGIADSDHLTSVVRYDGDTDQWAEVGSLARGRALHAVSRVPGATADYCQ